ncbi:MAG: PEP-CTERM sorting domain-containing protein [Bryobacteraceae bacterium]|nr:PEP-CTERM sorting domain-containing protein [Bryobacteraceae bacterium]
MLGADVGHGVSVAGHYPQQWALFGQCYFPGVEHRHFRHQRHFSDTVFADFWGDFTNITTAPVPEPSTWLLTLAGLGLALRRRR